MAYSKSRTNSLYGPAEFGHNDMLFVKGLGRKRLVLCIKSQNNSKFYPSVSGSFCFFTNAEQSKWLSYGKLRASWAQVGSIAGVEPYMMGITYAIITNQFNANAGY